MQYSNKVQSCLQESAIHRAVSKETEMGPTPDSELDDKELQEIAAQNEAAEKIEEARQYALKCCYYCGKDDWTDEGEPKCTSYKCHGFEKSDSDQLWSLHRFKGKCKCGMPTWSSTPNSDHTCALCGKDPVENEKQSRLMAGIPLIGEPDPDEEMWD